MLIVNSNLYRYSYKPYQYIFIMAIALFFPGMVSSFGLLLEQCLTMGLFLVGVVCIILYKPLLPKGVLYISFLLYAYFQIIITIDLLRSTDIIITSDFFEIAKPLYLYVFFIMPFCFMRTLHDVELVTKYLMIFCIILALFGIMEAWTKIGYDISTLLYKPIRDVLKNKAVASFIITYTFASFLVIPFFYYLTRFFSKKRFFNKDLIFLFLVLVCIFSTQSKTVFISILITLFLYLFLCLLYSFSLNKKKIILTILVLIVSLSVSLGVLASVFSEHFSYIYNGLDVVLTTLIDKGFINALNSTPSISLRVEQFEFALDAQDSIPLIGVAIGKGVLMPESFYALYLYRTGIIGIILHLSIVLYLFVSSYKCARFFANKNNIHMYSWFMALHFYALSLPFSYFSSAVNDQTRTGFVFYFLIASTIFIRRRICNYGK